MVGSFKWLSRYVSDSFKENWVIFAVPLPYHKTLEQVIKICVNPKTTLGMIAT